MITHGHKRCQYLTGHQLGMVAGLSLLLNLSVVFVRGGHGSQDTSERSRVVVR